MKSHLKRVFQKPWYPVLVSIYPVLALYAVNVNESRPDAIIRPILVFLAAGLLILLIMRVLLRDWHRAAFAACMWMILFSTYGHLVSFLELKEIEIPSKSIQAGWLFLAALFLWLASLKRMNISAASSSLNLIAAVLMVYPLSMVIANTVEKMQVGDMISPGSLSESIRPQDLGSLPDIYYIVLDSYGRADLLQQTYQYDNSGFVAELEQMGFFVANCSQSNYMRTDVALASTLNMDYLQNLSDKFKPDTWNRTRLFELLKHSKVRNILETAGYKTVAFATGFPWSEMEDASLFLAPSPLWSDLTDFEELLLNTTLARVLEDSGRINAFQISSQHYRERTSFILDSFPNLAKMPGPKFVFMHIIPPHPPFVFGPDGQATDPDSFHNKDDKITAAKYALGYTNQITYLNTRVEQALETLIHASNTPPVIILQGDHGPWMVPDGKRFWILDAIYLPGKDQQFYPTITPVNTFRIVLNATLGSTYPLLEDKSFFSPIPYIYDFKTISNPCNRK
jgi:hypothetical protein